MAYACLAGTCTFDRMTGVFDTPGYTCRRAVLGSLLLHIVALSHHRLEDLREMVINTASAGSDKHERGRPVDSKSIK